MQDNDRKRAFSLVEVVIIIFLISLIVALLVPKISESYIQPNLISKWKKEEKDTKYFFHLVKIFNEDYARDTNQDSKISSYEVFHYYLKYLGEGTFRDVDSKRYKYKYMNNKPVPKMSSDTMQYLIQKDKDMLIGFSSITENCDDTTPCAKLFFDVNGLLPPNKFGQDIFGFYVFKSKIEEFGYDKPYAEVEKDCSKTGSGKYCSKYYADGGYFK